MGRVERMPRMLKCMPSYWCDTAQALVTSYVPLKQKKVYIAHIAEKYLWKFLSHAFCYFVQKLLRLTDWMIDSAHCLFRQFFYIIYFLVFRFLLGVSLQLS